MSLRQESPAKRLTLLALKVVGGACWTAAYREAALETEETNTTLLPEAAIAFNLTWEAIYSAGGVWKWNELSRELQLQILINLCWLASDVRWLLKMKPPVFHPAMVALSVAYHVAFLARNSPAEAARLSAFWQNFAFSMHCALSKSNADTSSRARKFTLLRMTGTAIPTLTSGVLQGIETKRLVPGLGCVVFDLLSLSKQTRRRRTVPPVRA